MTGQGRVYRGETWHCRHTPRKHAFRYPYYFLSLDLDELEQMKGFAPLFGYNQRALVSIWDTDYLRGTGTLSERLGNLLTQSGVSPLPAKVRLLTVPRLLGYVFNPVNFYLCYDDLGALQLIVSEVNNTLGESHIYVCNNPEPGRSWIKFRFPKVFYVSPFLPVQGDYHLYYRESGNDLEIQVHIISGGKAVFSSAVRGKATLGNARHLALSMLRYPLTIWLTMVRIHWQAVLLYYRRKIGVVSKPQISGQSFVRKKPTLWIRARVALVIALNAKDQKIKILLKEV